MEGRDATLLQERTVRSVSFEEERVAETMWKGLGPTVTPTLCLLLYRVVGRRQQSWNWERREGWAEDVCKILLLFSLSYPGWIGDLVVVLFKLNRFCFPQSRVSFACDHIGE